MKIGIVSDTHGFIDDRVLAALSDCELCVHAGDIGNAEVLVRLRSITPNVLAVLGNNDVVNKWKPHEHSVLKSLAERESICLQGGRLVVVHGHKAGAPKTRHTRLRDMFPEAKAIVYGHSHHLICDQQAMPWVLNPGAAGRARTFGGPSCMMITINRVKRWRVETFQFKRI